MKTIISILLALISSVLIGVASGMPAIVTPIIFLGSFLVQLPSGSLASTVGGAFTETALLEYPIKASAIMMDDRINTQFQPQWEALRAIMSNMTARIQILQDAKKDYTARVMWDNYCDIVTAANEECTICGNEPSTNVQDYALDFEKVVNITIDENDFKANIYSAEDFVTKALLKADKELTEDFNAQLIAVLNANLGVNAMGTAGKGVVSGTDTYIAASYWNEALMAYFNRVAILNQFNSPIILDGSNLYERYQMAMASRDNAEGKGAYNLFQQIKYYADLANIDTINTPLMATYLISQNAIAIATKAYYEGRMITSKEFDAWTIPSQFMPGVIYDVLYTNSCSGDLLKHCYKVKLKGGIFANPTGCTSTNTGILRFLCGVANN